MEVLLVAARKDLVNEYVSIIQEAGLNPAVIDVDAFAVENMFELNYDVPQEAIALIDIGSSNVNINVLENGVTAFTRDVGIGGRQFTEEIQRALNISYEEAEAMKVGGLRRTPRPLFRRRSKRFCLCYSRQPGDRNPQVVGFSSFSVSHAPGSHLPFRRCGSHSRLGCCDSRSDGHRD